MPHGHTQVAYFVLRSAGCRAGKPRHPLAVATIHGVNELLISCNRVLRLLERRRGLCMHTRVRHLLSDILHLGEGVGLTQFGVFAGRVLHVLIFRGRGWMSVGVLTG